jgi:hypothetical protein
VAVATKDYDKTRMMEDEIQALVDRLAQYVSSPPGLQRATNNTSDS